jgi:uncharacterized protein YbgA (DUF1722 family)
MFGDMFDVWADTQYKSMKNKDPSYTKQTRKMYLLNLHPPHYYRSFEELYGLVDKYKHDPFYNGYTQGLKRVIQKIIRDFLNYTNHISKTETKASIPEQDGETLQ